MKRITRNERIKDITPERDRGPVTFKRGDADHDPMFPRPSWFSGLDPLPLPASPTPATPEPPLELQHNHHVTMYWNWRIDRMEARLHG